MNPNLQNKKKKFDNFIRYSGLGFEMMAIIGGFTFLGYKIDQWMDNNFKTFTVILATLSVILAIIYGTKGLLKKTADKNKNTDKEEKNS